MKILHLDGSEMDRGAADCNAAEIERASDFLDLATIRRRVANIKSTWTPAMVRARATEGRRRRCEIENLLEDLVREEWGDMPMDESPRGSRRSIGEQGSQDQHGLSLVG